MADLMLDLVVSRIRSLPGAPPGVAVAVSASGSRHCAMEGPAQAFDDSGPLPTTYPLDLQTRTDIGSVTKIVGTTLALMSLVDSGELDLAAPISRLLPWSAGTPVGSASAADLLQHRAGLWEWWPTYLQDGDPLTTIATLPLRYPPRRGRHYSDLGFILLGAVVSAVTGQPFSAAVSRLVLEPLGLAETSYAGPVPGGVVAASSAGDRIEREMVRTGLPYPVPVDGSHFGWREHVLVGEVNDGNAFHSFGSVAGHAGMFSSAADLLTVGDALLNCLAGRGHLSRATARRFFEPGLDPLQAIGFRIWPVGAVRAFGHTGFPGVALAVVPEQELTVVLVTNRLHVVGRPIVTETVWADVLARVTTQGESS